MLRIVLRKVLFNKCKILLGNFVDGSFVHYYDRKQRSVGKYNLVTDAAPRMASRLSANA